MTHTFRPLVILYSKSEAGQFLYYGLVHDRHQNHVSLYGRAGHHSTVLLQHSGMMS